MNRPTFLPLLLLATSFPSLAAAQTPDVAAVLARLRESHRDLVTLSARFIHTKETPLFDEKIVSSGTLYYRKSDKLLLQYTDPDSSLVLITGGRIWLYYPELEQAHRYEIDPELALPGVFLAFGGANEGLEERFDIELRPVERIGGYNVETLVLRPKPESDLAAEVESIELRFRTETDLPVRCEFREVSGDHTIFEFDGYRRNPSFRDDLFVFVPPPGTEVFDLEGESW